MYYKVNVFVLCLFIGLLTCLSCSKKIAVYPVWEYGGEYSGGEGPNGPEIVGPMTSILPIRNPERGLNLESNYFAHNLKNPWHEATFPTLWIPDVAVLNHAQADSLSLTQLTFYLSDFVGKDISTQAFDNMQRVLDDAVRLGYKAHIVFAYDFNSYATNAAFTDVFRHLEQLKPFVLRNLGVIGLWRMGFIGAWGEGNQSPMSNDWANKTLLVQKILDAYPDRFMALRYPSHLQEFVKRGLVSDYVKRIGYTNDYFTASEHPAAVGNDYTFNSEDYRQVQENGPFVQVVGEIPYDENTVWGLDFLISVPNTIKILKEHHYSAFDVTQNNALNIANWKRYEIKPADLQRMKVLYDDSYFRNAEGALVARSAYQFIRDHLGYRMYFDRKQTELHVEGGFLNYNIKLFNTGFSTILNPRLVKMVLLDESGAIVSNVERKDVDPRTWQPHDPAKRDYVQIYHSIKGQLSLPMSGKYRVGLLLQDPTNELKDRRYFDIVFANTPIVYTDNHRINIVGEITI